MTSTVTVEAHCSLDKEVVIDLLDIGDAKDTLNQTIVIQDGEKHVVHVYDTRFVRISEVEK